MATETRPRNQSLDTMRSGTLTLISAVLFAAAVAFTYVLSLSEPFNPPNWVRAVGLVWLPIGLAGVPIGYVVARIGDGRQRATVGVLIAVVALMAFVGLVVALG